MKWSEEFFVGSGHSQNEFEPTRKMAEVGGDKGRNTFR